MKKILLQAVTLVTILLVISFSQATAASTRDRILDEVTIGRVDEHFAIKVSFNFPIQYLRHYPPGFGKEIRIQFNALLPSPDIREGLQNRESLLPPKDNPAGLIRVEYEGDDLTQATLTVILAEQTPFKVKQGDDFRSLVVLVPIKKAPEGKPADDDSAQDFPDQKTKKPAKVAVPLTGPGALTPERQESFLKEGEAVMASKNYPRAIQIYTKLLDSPDIEVVEMAQFQLALAREFNGHLAHAKAEYRNYLTEYPDGEKVEEAEARLRALMSGRLFTGDYSLAATESSWQSDFYGSISQFFDWDESFAEDNEDDDDTVNISSLSTGVDATWRLRNDHYQFKTVFIGRQEFDLTGDGDDESRVSRLYLDFEDLDRIVTTRVGRQTANSGGVLGRFDGGHFSYLFHDKVRLNLVAGFPVNRSSDGFESSKYFYGINFDFGRFADHWDFNAYAINQIADGIADRRAIGGEIRYVGNRGSVFTLLDYDLLFNKVNIALLTGNWLLPNDKTRLNFSADFRNSPLLSTSNGLIGQLSPSLEILEEAIGESALRQLAEDRTLGSSFVTIGASHPLSDKFQISGDVSWSKLDGSPASGGVEAFESTGDEFFYSLQLTGSNLLTEGDISTIGLRYSDAKTRDTYTLNLNSRYPINHDWRLNPRLQVDYRNNKQIAGTQWRFRPSLRVEYLLRKNWRFELEGGLSCADQELPGIAEDTLGYYISAGLRWDF